MDEPPLLQIGHATGHLHGILTQSVDQHRALWTNTSQTLQQRTQRSQLGHLQKTEREAQRVGEKRNVGAKSKRKDEEMMWTRKRLI